MQFHARILSPLVVVMVVIVVVVVPGAVGVVMVVMTLKKGMSKRVTMLTTTW